MGSQTGNSTYLESVDFACTIRDNRVRLAQIFLAIRTTLLTRFSDAGGRGEEIAGVKR